MTIVQMIAIAKKYRPWRLINQLVITDKNSLYKQTQKKTS